MTTYKVPQCACIQERNEFQDMKDVEIIDVGYTIAVDIANEMEWGCSHAELPLNYCPSCGQPYRVIHKER